MADKPFSEPRLGLNRIYTRAGDAGETRLASGEKIAKDDPRIECYGAVDELNAFVGLAAITAEALAEREPRLKPLVASLVRVQHELFNLGSVLATRPEHIHPKQARVRAGEISKLEEEIDTANQELPALRSFVLPGGSRLNAELHVCRTVCRRAERRLVALARGEEAPGDAIRYLNRLSDAFFVWSRWGNHLLGAGEVLWDPNASASGSTG